MKRNKKYNDAIDSLISMSHETCLFSNVGLTKSIEIIKHLKNINSYVNDLETRLKSYESMDIEKNILDGERNDT